MKTHLLPALIITVCCIFLFCGAYTAVVWAIAQLAPQSGDGITLRYTATSTNYGYEDVGQSFTADNYFWSRPSAAGYNAAGSAGSNKGPSNPEYLSQVKARIDTFLLHNPGIEIARIPADLVTASGSGLDPNITPEAALIQAPRIARTRGISESQVTTLIDHLTDRPLFGFLGKPRINVLKLNCALDNETRK